jgi:hypothetical protein
MTIGKLNATEVKLGSSSVPVRSEYNAGWYGFSKL